MQGVGCRVKGVGSRVWSVGGGGEVEVYRIPGEAVVPETPTPLVLSWDPRRRPTVGS